MKKCGFKTFNHLCVCVWKQKKMNWNEPFLYSNYKMQFHIV